MPCRVLTSAAILREQILFLLFLVAAVIRRGRTGCVRRQLRRRIRTACICLQGEAPVKHTHSITVMLQALCDLFDRGGDRFTGELTRASFLYDTISSGSPIIIIITHLG